ncbi:hypothetical protein H6CHR_00192 [Variovorax sp. PBL-H6]|uniref:hypothetical protein n=1 Tax=Variovorax sp. PBL-H6 TaxID=434009 RepID=UPI001318175B|nr:hypothetical protein [Variovorax sp. PBL-H6]VTU15323.1 hypothetical protein H6CHR_00192 [Variovorax sp. PBL-H6]
MPKALLHRIAHHPLPLVLTTDPDIQAILPLIHAGHVKAAMPVTLDPWGGGPQVGVVVTELTAAGGDMLKRSRE